MKRPRKKTAFVPSVVFGTVVLGVVPACAVSCGGSTSSPGDASADATRDGWFGVAGDAFPGVAGDAFPGVAAVAFCGFCDAGNPADAAEEPDVGVLGVAVCGFCDGGDASDTSDASDAHDAEEGG